MPTNVNDELKTKLRPGTSYRPYSRRRVAHIGRGNRGKMPKQTGGLVNALRRRREKNRKNREMRDQIKQYKERNFI